MRLLQPATFVAVFPPAAAELEEQELEDWATD
jgi:hypothetical protein